MRSHTVDHEIKRIYWTIGSVAKKYEIAASKIRFWCDQFEIDPMRDHKGDRRFRESTLSELHLVYILVEKLRFTLPGAYAILQVMRRSNHASDHMILQIKQMYELIFDDAFPDNPMSHDDKTA